MEKSPEDEYEKFLDFCSMSLKGENPKFLDLIKSRYAACDERFRSSGEMVKLLEKTQRNMASEDSRKFVHLKDFLTKLKINTAAKWKKKQKKRKHSSDSDTETTHLTKIQKLKDCSVVMAKFPDDDLALFACDAVVDDESNSTELHAQKSCSIADGDVNGALSILVANDEQVIRLKEQLGSAIDYSDSQFSEPSFRERVEFFGKGAVERGNSTFGSCSLSSHIPFSTRGSSSRKPVVYLDIDDDYAEEDQLEIGSVDSNDNDNFLVSTIFPAEDSEQLQNENDEHSDIETSQNESVLAAVSIANEPPRRKSTFIVDVKLSDSPGVLVILPSSSCQTLKGFSEIESINSQTEHQEKAQDTLTSCNEKDSVHNIRLDTILDDTVPLTSAYESKEATSSISFEAVFEKPPIRESIEHSALSSLTTSTETIKKGSFQNTANIELENGLDDVGKDALPCEETIQENQKGVQKQDTLMSEVVQENQKGIVNVDTSRVTENKKYIQNLDALSEVKNNVDKLIKRVPLLSVTKDASSSSGSAGVKPFLSSFSKQENAVQKPSTSSETKIVPASVEAKPPESGDSADEFQKSSTDHILDKSQLKQKRRVAKLEHLIESLRDEIEKCQDAEMTLDDLDDDNAAYIYEDKLKRKFVAVWNKLCEVTERTITTGRPTEKRVRYSGTRYQEINRRIEKFLNKKKVFPDFYDIKSIVKLTNKKCNLNLSVMMSNDIAREAFVDIGEMLQTRRHQDFIATFGTRQTDVLRGSSDPYLTDPEFRRKVDSNRQVAKCNLDNIIAKYTKLQKERLYGEDGEEPGEESEEDEEDINRKTEKTNSEKPEKHQDAASRTPTEDATAESFEVDMAEENNEEMTKCSSPAAHDASQQPPDKYRPTLLTLGRSAYLLSPDKGKTTTKSLFDTDKSVDEELDASSSADRPELASLGDKDDSSSCNAASIIVIDESPAKSQQELRKSSFDVKFNPFNLDKQSSIKSDDSEKGNQPVKDVTAADKRGPNIKFTTRKPLHLERIGVSIVPASDGLGELKFDSDTEGLKSRMSSVCEIFDDDEDDQSSESPSEQDADDKLADDDVDEIVMIIDRSESECDTVSTRDPSPISVVSLSSESLDDMTDDWEKDDLPTESATMLSVSTPVNLVSSPEVSNKHSQMQKDDTCEQRQFLEAIGIHKNENNASVSCSLNDEELHEKNKDTLLCQTIEEGEITTDNQKHALIDVDLTDRQQKNPMAESFLRDRHTSAVNRISQDSDDCIIIHDIRSTNEVGDTEKANLVAGVGDSQMPNKKTFDLQLSPEEFSAAENDQVNFTNSPANKTAGESTTEMHQELSVKGKQIPETDKKKLASKEPTEMFSQAAVETGFARANAQQSDSGIAEKLYSLNSLLQKISSSTSDSCMLQDVSTVCADSHGNFSQEALEDKIENAEINVSESSSATGTSKSCGMDDNNICLIDGDTSNDSSQTAIHIMDVCSIMPEPCSTSNEQNSDALSSPNTGECLNKITSSHSDTVQSQSAARNKAVAFSVVGDSCYQDPSSLPRDSSVLSNSNLKSTDNKSNSRNSTVKTVQPSSLFETSISAGLNDGDSQDSCIEIIDTFDEDIEEICDSDSTFYPQPSPFQPKCDNSFYKPQKKVADTASNQTAMKETKVRQNVAGETKLAHAPITDKYHASYSRSVQMKSSQAEKNLIREEPDNAIIIDLCESSSVPVIRSEHTKIGTVSIAKQEINVDVDMQEKFIVEDKATEGNCSLQTEITIVESPELFEYKNNSIETPKQVKDKNNSIETPKQVKDKNNSIETPKQVKDKNNSIETPKDKCKNMNIETPKDKCENVNIETPKGVKDKNSLIETPNKDELENTKRSCEQISENLLIGPEQTVLDDVAVNSILHIDNSVHQDTLRASSSEGGKPFIDQEQDKAFCESEGIVQSDRIGNDEGNVNNNGNDRENVYTVDSYGKSNCSNEEHFQTNNGGTNKVKVHGSGDVHIDSLKNIQENVLSIGSDKEIVHIGDDDDDDGETVHPKSVGNDERNVHNNSFRCDPENVSSESIFNTGSVENEGELVHTNTAGNNDTGINEENIQADDVGNNGENFLVIGVGVIEENVQVSVGTNVQADVGNNGGKVGCAVINEENVQVDSVGEIVEENGVGNNGGKVLVDGGEINEENIQADSVGNNGENVQADCGENGENVEMDDGNSGENVKMDEVGNKAENVQTDNGNNSENVEMKDVGNNRGNVQTDVREIGENFQMEDVRNNGENVCVWNTKGDGSRDKDEINNGNELMDSTGEDKSSKLCDEITGGENTLLCDTDRKDTDGGSHDTDVQVTRSEDECVDKGIGQIVEHERNQKDQGEIVQRSDNDLNKASQGLEVEGGTGDDDSVDLLSTDSPNWDVEEEAGGSQDSQSKSIKQTGKVTESAGLEADGGEKKVLKQQDLDGDRGGVFTEDKDEDWQKGQEHSDEVEQKRQGDLKANSEDEHTLGQGGLDADGHSSKQLDVGAKSGVVDTSTQSDLDTNRGDGNTEQKDLNVDNKGEHTSKHRDLNTDMEDSATDDQESLSIVLDYQSVRSLDTAATQAEVCNRDVSSNDSVTECASKVTEKLPETTLSDKMEDPSNVIRCDEELEETGRGCDEGEAAVADDDDSSSELASLRQCKGNEDSKNEEKSEPVAKNAEKDDSSKHIGSSSVDDEDEIKIIEELSSVKGVRHSDKSKEEDRRLVDQLLLDIGLSTVKEPKLAIESRTDTVLAGEPGKSSDMSEEVTTEQSIHEPGDPAERSPPENDNSSTTTNSLCHTSVLSVECEEVDEGELSPAASCVQDVDSVESQPKVKNRKRPFDDTGSSELQGEGNEDPNSEEKDSAVSSPASSSVIDVEMLPQIKKSKVVDHDLINEVISSVLAEFPLSGITKFPASKLKQTRLMASKTTKVPELVVGDDDDDVVVIMEESSSEAVKPPIFPVALHKNRSHGPMAFRQQSSVTAFRQQSSLGRGVPSSANPPFRRHPVMQTYGNSNNAAQNVPSTSFQPPPQMSSSNGRRFSFAPKTRSPGFMRTKNSLASTVITGQNRVLPGGRVDMSQSLPRLSPRVPIPSIQPDRAGELTKTPPKPLPGTSASFVNKRFQSPTSGHIRSPASGHIRSPTAGNIRSPTVGQIRSPNVGHIRSPTHGHSGNTFRPNLPAMPYSRKRTYMSSMPSLPSNNLSSGVALRGSGRPTSYPKQPPLGALHNTARQQPHNIVPPQRLQPQQFYHGSKSNRKPKQPIVGSRVEIIVGDSDDEGDCNNTSSGPRIVSVSSLSTAGNSDTSPGNPSRAAGSRAETQSHRPNRDVIVIPD